MTKIELSVQINADLHPIARKLVILTRKGRYFWPVHMSWRVWPVQPVTRWQA